MRAWIEKQQYLMDFTLSSLLRRKVKNVSLLLLYTLIVFILASVMFFTDSIKKEASVILHGSPEIIVQKLRAGRHELFPIGQIEQLKTIRGVASVEGRLWGYYFDPDVGANFTFLGTTTDGESDAQPDVSTSVVVEDDEHEGSAAPSTAPLYHVKPGTLKPGTMVIGQGMARLRHASTGDLLAFRAFDGTSVNFRIADTFTSNSELVSADLIVVTETDFRRLFGIPGDVVTDVILSVSNPREIPTVAAKIAKALPDARPITRDEVLRTYDSIFNWRGGMMLVLLSGAVLAFVIFAWDKASGLSAGEKQEIGILKAIGWETEDIIQMKFWEGAVVSLTAFFTGVILAYLHVFLLSSVVFEAALKGWSTLYPQFQLTPFVNAAQLTTLFFLTVVPYTTATIVPIWRAATLDPDTAMRSVGE
ncbi:MAG: FtsX-like permease family protein [Nitrospirales bacterium]|nr:FtsX-like permease family protein [Nitrospira sp.]MCW5784048.1 FtsX-like permease family protein [Nitrospirales bacterium]